MNDKTPENNKETETIDAGKNAERAAKNVKVFWVVALVSAVMFALVMFSNEQSKTSEMIEKTGGVVESLPKIGQAGQFSFIDRSGKTITEKDMQDKIWVMDLIFTNCEGPCPLMSHHMSRLQRSFIRHKNVKFVSITIDPETDTVPVLKEYAEKYKAIEDKWYFLTGEKSKIVDFAVKSLKIPAGDNPMLHSTRFVLLDQSGEIRGYYDSQDKAQMERLNSHIKLLLASPAT